MTSAVPNPPQLTPQNLRELQMARLSLRKIRRAVSTAKFEGYTVAIFGAITVLCGMSSFTDMLAGTVLAAIGVVEIVGAHRLAQLNISAVRLLTINQLCLAALILLYAGWNLHAEIVHPAASDIGGLSASDIQALGAVGSATMDLTHEIMLLLYGSLIAAAAVEAGMAAYYHSRGAHLDHYLAQTPQWIITMQKSGVSI
jgi:hypothetical protein